MEHLQLKIHGIVQGVGFRPFLHRMVNSFGLTGQVRNTSSGVELELEGEREALERFVQLLPEQAPVLSMIESMETHYGGTLQGYDSFAIIASRKEELRNTLLSPDLAICPDCRRELMDPADRRYHYPFLNCTNCGPRFTIIRDVPYDRSNTSMAGFAMCPECGREYGDINDRRYHAQPDCCPVCGPRLQYLDAEGTERPGDAIAQAAAALEEGRILAVKGLGGFHLACRADRPELVQLLRRRKQRDEKAFAVMCRDVDTVRKFCELSEAEKQLLQGHTSPIVLLKKRASAPEGLSDNGRLGVMLPYTPLHVLLMEQAPEMLVMTSANLSDTPIVRSNAEALERLKGIADGFLLHDREILTRCDDSLCCVLEGEAYFFRRSRGYVPYPIPVKRSLPPILACGAEQKASFCLSREEHAFPAQHIGDLKNLETLEHYSEQIRHFERMFDIQPSALVCDLHPDYLSTAYAAERAEKEKLPLLQVQHHHAHLAACMADNGLEGEVIGLVWDGTGLGTDGSIWGAECLIGGYSGVRRAGSIRPIALIGGDRVTKEPLRTAFALLSDAGCDTSRIPEGETYRKMLNSGLNCPVSSGMGRLFDGVSALLGICPKCSYEGQAAMLLEAAADPGCTEAYPVLLEGDPLRLDWRPMLRCMMEELTAGESTGRMAAKFMNTLIAYARQLCITVREQTGLNRVCLSGGSFQNLYLMERLLGILREAGFEVYRHHRVAPNDEGIALGQLMIAAAALEKGN